MSSRRSSSSLAVAALFAAVSAAGPAGAEETAAWNPLPALYSAEQVASLTPSGAVLLAAGATRAARAESDRSPRPKKALLLSLLLPGAGELYSGDRGRATGFFIAEGAIWAHFVGWEIAGHLRKNNYIEQAQLNAGVGTDSEGDEYWRLVGQYERSSGSGPGSYEEALRREARDQYPTDPAAQDAYVAERLPTGASAWSWSAPALQQTYRATREDANRAFNRAELSFAFAVLNRIASAIDTQILHSRRSKGGDAQRLDEEGVHLIAGMAPDGSGRISLRSRF